MLKERKEYHNKQSAVYYALHALSENKIFTQIFAMNFCGVLHKKDICNPL